MKIITWNVNGLRAWLKKGMWDWIDSESPDVVCLQEIKARPDQLTEEQHQLWDGLEAAWNPAERPGYSGVATFSRQGRPERQSGVAARRDAVASQLGMDAPRFDVEGRVIQSRFPDFRLFNIYFPNGQRDHTRLQYKLDFYAHLLDLCDQLHKAGERIVLCGDFNTAHQEIDLRNPKQNQKTSGFLPEERAWIDTYLAHGFVDVYREMYPDRVQYTWWTYRYGARRRNVGWRLDYFLVSAGLVDRVEDVVIHDGVMGSDHCPVALVIG